MARNWRKFSLDEIAHLWMRHKEKTNRDPLCLGNAHPKLEITKEELEDLIEILLQRMYEIRHIIARDE